MRWRTEMLSLESGVLDRFHSVVAEDPERTAIAGSGRHISYAELLTRASAVARRLGPRPGVVAVPATHSPATIASLLGVWAAGGTYCPIDPAFPPARREAMLAAAGDADGLDGVAYILFTSGSTGEPRPVLTPHTAIDATVGSLCELFDLRPADRVLQFASLNWDTCFEEILPALTTGACLVLHDDAHSGSFRRFLRMVAQEGITVLDLPTAFWHELVNHLVEEGSPLPECVRLVIIGGEAANPTRLVDWCTPGTAHARLVNTYGCTETTLITHAVDLFGPLAPAVPQHVRVPIGRPLPHVVEHITEAGELLIGGPGLAAGYRGRPEDTARRFITLDGQRFFRTGDRVTRLHDTTLVHEGRLDAEIKVRGIRVDPAEVEAHLAGHPSVRAVAVTAAAVADHTALVAYVVARSPERTQGLDTTLIDYLRDRVPPHLVPSRIRIVADLVYTASGKVDRHRIKEALG
jgi:non-ribosomal peptide synthetase component F